MEVNFIKALDIEFARNLTKSNMIDYYDKLSLQWNDDIFNQSWSEFYNYEILENNNFVGLLRICCDDTTFYIKDLQIIKTKQNMGFGRKAIQKTIKIATEKLYAKMLLEVFKINRAKNLYDEIGFRVVREDNNLFIMELKLPHHPLGLNT